MSPRLQTNSGTFVPVEYLSGYNSGCPFRVLSEGVAALQKYFSIDQVNQWAAIEEEVDSIEEDSEIDNEDRGVFVADVVSGFEVAELMNSFAPEGHWWGHHPDGGCLGYWPDSWLE